MSTDRLSFTGMPDEPIRIAMCDWLERHGIDHKRVPVPCTITRYLLPDLPGIEYPRYVTDENDRIQLTPDRLDAAIEDVWMPMEADPLPFPAEVVGGVSP